MIILQTANPSRQLGIYKLVDKKMVVLSPFNSNDDNDNNNDYNNLLGDRQDQEGNSTDGAPQGDGISTPIPKTGVLSEKGLNRTKASNQSLAFATGLYVTELTPLL